MSDKQVTSRFQTVSIFFNQLSLGPFVEIDNHITTENYILWLLGPVIHEI